MRSRRSKETVRMPAITTIAAMATLLFKAFRRCGTPLRIRHECSRRDTLCWRGIGWGCGTTRSSTRQRILPSELGCAVPVLCLARVRMRLMPAWPEDGSDDFGVSSQFRPASLAFCLRAMAPEMTASCGTWTMVPSQRTIRLAAFWCTRSTLVPRGNCTHP